jgi:hypothetical protein
MCFIIYKERYFPDLSFFPSFSIPDVLYDLADLIWRKETPFEAITARTAPLSHDILAEFFQGFPQLQGKCQEICAQPRDHFIISLIIGDRRDWRDTRASGLWLGTRIGSGGTAKLA